MSFWDYAFPLYGIGHAIANSKDKYNAGIDAQIAANKPVRPTPIDPNSLGSVLPGLEQRQANAGQASPWLGLAQSRNALQTANASQAAQGQALGAEATARSQLAMRGGLSGGAAERLAGMGAQNGAAATQQVANQGLMNNASLAMNDYQQNLAKTSVWAQLAANEQNAKNNLRISNNDLAGKIYGADTLANSELAQSKKNGLLGLGFLGL